MHARNLLQGFVLSLAASCSLLPSANNNISRYWLRFFLWHAHESGPPRPTRRSMEVNGTSRQEQVQALQSPKRNSRPPEGRVCARQGTQPLPATKQPPSGWTCVRPGSEPSPCRLRTSSRPSGRVCAWQCTQPLPATKQPPSGWMCVRPAVNPAPAGYKPAAVRTDVCAPGSEPSPCRLRNSRRPEGCVCAWQ